MAEAQKCEEVLKMLQDQKEALWERLAQRMADASAERERQIEAGEEESRVEITMDMTDLDYSIITEQG